MNGVGPGVEFPVNEAAVISLPESEILPTSQKSCSICPSLRYLLAHQLFHCFKFDSISGQDIEKAKLGRIIPGLYFAIFAIARGPSAHEAAVQVCFEALCRPSDNLLRRLVIL